MCVCVCVCVDMYIERTQDFPLCGVIKSKHHVNYHSSGYRGGLLNAQIFIKKGGLSVQMVDLKVQNWFKILLL